jgi:hypothetical protein
MREGSVKVSGDVKYERTSTRNLSKQNDVLGF